MCTPSVSLLRDTSSDIIVDPKSMAEIFASSFASVYTSSTLHLPASHQQFDGHKGNITVTLEHFHTAISKLDPSSAVGRDEIHPLLFKGLPVRTGLPTTNSLSYIPQDQ